MTTATVPSGRGRPDVLSEAKGLRPMLCQLAQTPPVGPEWAYEMKWDGVRALVAVHDGRVLVVSRNGDDVTVAYPELQLLGAAVGSRPLLLDGEIVVLDPNGRPSFSALSSRIHVVDADRAGRLSRQVPAMYMAFDVLDVDGRRTTGLPYDERRQVLESLELAGTAWATPPAFVDRSGADLLAAAAAEGMEGIVAKRRTSIYVPGRRTNDWRKVKHFRTQEVVIGGWVPGKGRRGETFGALLMGVPSGAGAGGRGGTAGRLHYVGKVGTGFSDPELARLEARMEPLARPDSPFDGPLPRAQVKEAHWLEPELVGEVRYAERTPEGRLRHPSWRGLRGDKPPSDVVSEG